MQMLRRAVMANPELLGPMLQVGSGRCKQQCGGADNIQIECEGDISSRIL
jgi:hypothetical protein